MPVDYQPDLILNSLESSAAGPADGSDEADGSAGIYDCWGAKALRSPSRTLEQIFRDWSLPIR